MTKESVSSFAQQVRSPWRFRLYLLFKLPSALFAGVRMESYTSEACVISVPYGWRTRNPFASTYFACLSMAAEMSTGIPAMAAVTERKAGISLLVVSVNGTFHKKAKGRTYFRFEDLEALDAAVDRSEKEGIAQTFLARSKGLNSAGELIAEFEVTWSFRLREAGRRVQS